MSQPPEPAAYLPRLGLFSAAMAVVGGIIGAGIFLNPAIVAARVGTSSLVITTWVLGAVVAIAGALVFAELGSRHSAAGGGYVYLRDAFGPLPAFLYGWTLLLVINTGSIAAVALTFAGYAADLLGLSDSAVRPLAVGSIVALSIINYLGVRSGALVQNLLTLLKLAALALLIGVGLTTSVHAPAPPLSGIPVAPDGAWPVFMAIGAALIPILFAYGGWQNTNFIAAEIRDAQRQLPRALLLGIAIVVLVYVLVNVAYLRVLGVAGLAASRAPASEVMRAGLGTTGGTIIAAGIVASTFGFLNLVILTAPRVYQAMAADGLFFQSVARLHPRYRTPSVALGLQAVASLAVLLTGGYAQLVNFNTVGDWLFFGLTGATIFAFRRRDRLPGAPPRPAFLMPFHPWPSILFGLAAIYAVISAIRTSPLNAAIAVGLIALGIPAYLLGRRQLGITPPA
jgi:basic amino acid/polyamine antiporter, APA family